MNKEVTRYPTYKPSCIDWLGVIPSHWELSRLKWATELPVNGVWGSEANGDEYDTLCIRVADFDRQRLIVDKQNEKTYREIEDKDLKNRSLKTGDLLLEKSGGGEKQLVGAVIQYDLEERAVSSNFVARMRPRESFDSRYLAYLYKHLYSGNVNYCSIKQTTGIQNLDSQAYLDEKVAFPPYPEQKAIASFLNHQTSRIDQLIEKKKRLLELPDEQRQAIITNAVTKGINPDAPMKESGIDWLGDVPEHWDIEKLKYFIQLNSREVDFDDDEDIVKVALENIESGTGKLSFEDDDKSFQGKGNPFSNGDILFNKLRPYLAKVIHAEFNGVAVGELLVLTPDKSALESKFLFYRLLSDQFIKIVNNSTYGAKMPRANWDFIGNLRIGIPPLHEQLEIGTYLNQRVKQFDHLKTKIQTAIDRLEEYRSSLITQAVTGKIDVRDTVQEVEMSYAAEEGELYKTNE